MFDVRNLSVLAYANGFTLWHYKAPGSLAPVQAPGFFDGAADMLASGDMMLLSGPEGGGVACMAVSEGRVVAARLG